MRIGDKVWTVVEYMTSSRDSSYMYCLEEYQIVSHEPHFGMVCVTDGHKIMFYHSNDLIFTKPEGCTEEDYRNWYNSSDKRRHEKYSNTTLEHGDYANA